MVWKAETLGEICDRVGGIIQTGPFGSQLHQSDYSDDGIPVVMPKNIIEGRIVMDDIACVAPAHVARLSRHKLKPGDIVYGRRGDIGRQALIRQQQAGWLCGTGCLRLSLGDSVIDPIFLHYYLREPDTIGWIANQAIGSTMPNLNTSILRSVPIRFPLLFTQRKIAAILSAYDDLIENNLRRIKILEEMAQNLYREWFVKFRFPGHQNARFIDSPLGRIPDEWEVKTLGEIATVVTKGTTPTTFGKDFKAEGTNFFKVESIDQTGGIEENKLAKIDAETHEMLKRSQIICGDILFSIAGAIGRTTIVPQRLLPANTNQALAIIRIPNEIHRVYIFHCVRADEFQHFSLGHVVQTAQANVSLGILKSTPILMPPDAILSRFMAAALSVTQMQENLKSRNITLRRTRDLLLPKLISGEVDVSELDITVPEEGAA